MPRKSIKIRSLKSRFARLREGSREDRTPHLSDRSISTDAAVVPARLDRPTKPRHQLTGEQQKAILSLENWIAEHEKKLEELTENPTEHHGMKRLPKDLIEKQQKIRGEHLEHEIRTFRKNVEKIKRGELKS